MSCKVASAGSQRTQTVDHTLFRVCRGVSHKTVACSRQAHRTVAASRCKRDIRWWSTWPARTLAGVGRHQPHFGCGAVWVLIVWRRCPVQLHVDAGPREAVGCGGHGVHHDVREADAVAVLRRLAAAYPHHSPDRVKLAASSARCVCTTGHQQELTTERRSVRQSKTQADSQIEQVASRVQRKAAAGWGITCWW